MYYICIEIWEEPRLPPFFVTFPLKTGVLGAHPGKIRGRQRKIRGRQRKIRGRQRKTARRVGKIGRRKVFSKVKNVNVESLKNDSKLLDFWWRAGVTSRLVGVTYGLSVRPHQCRVRLRAAARAAIFAGV